MTERPKIVCIGAMLWDVIGKSPSALHKGIDRPGLIVQRPGGVALNIAIALARRNLHPAILSAVGEDGPGRALVSDAEAQGVDCRWLSRTATTRTDIYMAIEDPDGLFASLADARALEAAGEAVIAPLLDGRLGHADAPFPGIVILDSNLPADVIARFATDPALSGLDLRLVPASPAKGDRFRPLLREPRACFYLNLAEASSLAHRPVSDAREAADLIARAGARRVIVTDGPHQVAEAGADLPPLTTIPPRVTPVQVTGAGDAFLAAHLSAELSGADRQTSLAAAVHAAADHVSGKEHAQ